MFQLWFCIFTCQRLRALSRDKASSSWSKKPILTCHSRTEDRTDTSHTSANSATTTIWWLSVKMVLRSDSLLQTEPIVTPGKNISFLVPSYKSTNHRHSSQRSRSFILKGMVNYSVSYSTTSTMQLFWRLKNARVIRPRPTGWIWRMESESSALNRESCPAMTNGPNTVTSSWSSGILSEAKRRR